MFEPLRFADDPPDTTKGDTVDAQRDQERAASEIPRDVKESDRRFSALAMDLRQRLDKVAVPLDPSTQERSERPRILQTFSEFTLEVMGLVALGIAPEPSNVIEWEALGPHQHLGRIRGQDCYMLFFFPGEIAALYQINTDVELAAEWRRPRLLDQCKREANRIAWHTSWLPVEDEGNADA